MYIGGIYRITYQGGAAAESGGSYTPCPPVDAPAGVASAGNQLELS
jgi:hypothetical protein